MRTGDLDSEKPLQNLTVVVLTFNEEMHIRRCLSSVFGLARRIVVVDSGSTDRTCAIAAECGADVFTNPWISHSYQLNWSIGNTQIDTEWIFRLDADEIATPQLRKFLRNALPRVSPSTAGLTVNRQIHFMGKWIKHGGIYPTRILRIWRTRLGRCEDRWMDEHIVVSGKIAHLNADIADINLNSVTWWIAKHNQYAIREAVELLKLSEQIAVQQAKELQLNRQARIKRWLKARVYAHLPLGARSIAYFLYRYLLCFGFLDGWHGLAFHFLQGLWYRFLVDVKVYELRSLMTTRHQTLSEVAKQEFDYEI